MLGQALWKASSRTELYQLKIITLNSDESILWLCFCEYRQIYLHPQVNELTRNEIASLILGVLDAEMCRAKYKYKRRKLLLVH